MASFFSKTPQTACLSNASDAISFTGVTPKNKAIRIKKSPAHIYCIDVYFESKTHSKNPRKKNN